MLRKNYTLTAKGPEQKILEISGGFWGSRVWGYGVRGSRGSRATDFGSGRVHSGNLESGGLESGGLESGGLQASGC